MRGAIGFDGLIFSDDTSMKALRGSFAEKTRAIFAAGLDIVLHCNGDLTEARAVVAETPELKGEALRRAEAALEMRRRRAAGLRRRGRPRRARGAAGDCACLIRENSAGRSTAAGSRGRLDRFFAREDDRR